MITVLISARNTVCVQVTNIHLSDILYTHWSTTKQTDYKPLMVSIVSGSLGHVFPVNTKPRCEKGNNTQLLQLATDLAETPSILPWQLL